MSPEPEPEALPFPWYRWTTPRISVAFESSAAHSAGLKCALEAGPSNKAAGLRVPWVLIVSRMTPSTIPNPALVGRTARFHIVRSLSGVDDASDSIDAVVRFLGAYGFHRLRAIRQAGKCRMGDLHCACCPTGRGRRTRI